MHHKSNRVFQFNLLSVIYIVTSFCFTFNISLFRNLNKILIFEFFYILVSAVFSLFVLSLMLNYFKKWKMNYFQSKKQLEIKLNVLHLFALGIWVLFLLFQTFYSLNGILSSLAFKQKFEDIYLSDELLNNLFIVLLSLTLYLLFFILSAFVLTLIFVKSKTVIINFSQIEEHPLIVIWTIKKDEVQEDWMLFSMNNLLYSDQGYFEAAFLVREILNLKLKTIQSDELREIKKQTTPPAFLF